MTRTTVACVWALVEANAVIFAGVSAAENETYANINTAVWTLPHLTPTVLTTKG